MDKYDNKPHYVLCSVDKLNLVLYSFGDDGGGSTLIQNLIEFPKKLKKRTKTRFDGKKIKSIETKIYNGK